MPLPFRVRLLRTLLPAAVALAAGCGGLSLPGGIRPEAGDWTADGGGPRRSAVASSWILPPLAPVWEAELGSGAGRGSPLLTDSVVVIATLRGEILVFDARTGARLGGLGLGETITGSPALSGDTLYVPFANARTSVLAYDLRRGTTLWRASCGDVEASLLLAAGCVYAATTGGTLVCLDAATGAERWTFTLPDNRARKGIRSAPAADGSLVVFGADDGYVYALDAATGAERRRWNTGAPVTASPALVQGLVLAANLRGDLLALDSAAVRWRHAAGSPVRGGIAAADGMAIVGTSAGRVRAVDLGTGDLLWERETAGGVDAGGAISGSLYYAGTLRGRLMALRLADGATVWEDSLGGRVKSAPAAAHGLLVVAADNRLLRGYRRAGP